MSPVTSPVTTTKRAVVTGAAGFIGSHLSQALLDDGWQVTGIDHRRGHPAEVTASHLRPLQQNPRFVLVPVDLADAELEPLLVGADTIFHLAARPGVRSSWGAEFADYTASNVLGANRLLDAASRAGVRRVVVSSSSSVYGGADGDERMAETRLTTPMSPYGASKLATEQLGLMYAKKLGSTMSVVALRYFTVYGPRQRADMAIRMMITAALTGEPFTVFGDGLQRRDFTYVADVVRANLLASQAEVHAIALNIGSGYQTTVLNLLDLVGQIVGSPVPVIHGPESPGDVRDTYADITLAGEVLGYRPTVDLATGISHQVEWVRSLPEIRKAQSVRV